MRTALLVQAIGMIVAALLLAWSARRLGEPYRTRRDWTAGAIALVLWPLAVGAALLGLVQGFVRRMRRPS